MQSERNRENRYWIADTESATAEHVMNCMIDFSFGWTRVFEVLRELEIREAAGATSVANKHDDASFVMVRK